MSGQGSNTMAILLNEILPAVLMVVLAVGLFFAWRRYLRRNSERRMRAMLEAVGLKPSLASSGHVEAIMKEVRARCRTCNAEDVCERWLASDARGDNDFCPNAHIFELLGEHGRKAQGKPRFRARPS
jgi:uncharacterized protein YneF (UPF0154 family)